MARTDGRPDDESLARAVEQLKRDGLAWASAEQELLKAKVKSTVRRVELALLIILVALMVTVAGMVTLADAAVQGLASTLGPLRAGIVVGIGALMIGGLLILWVKALLHPADPTRRAQSTMKVIWRAFNEPN